MFEELYEWYMGQLDHDDQEVIRLLRKTGEDIMANKPDSRGGSTRTISSYDESMVRMNYYLNPNQYMTGPGESKWQRIGKPLFTPAFEMVMFFTPMNPVVYRALRAIKLGIDETV